MEGGDREASAKSGKCLDGVFPAVSGKIRGYPGGMVERERRFLNLDGG